MKQNAFLAKQQIRRELERAYTTRLIRRETADIAALVLYEEFGFGPERQKRFNQRLNAKLNELLDIAGQDTKDLEYTKTKIDQELMAACGPYYLPREERYGDG